MADVITRLKLESGEYDSKIKRAVTGLQQMENECRKVGGTLAILEKDQKEYVQSLGSMQTVSQTTRGKISELSSAFVELRSQYNRLTDEEKKGDFGRALSGSLEQLKTRVAEAKRELSDITKELNSNGGAQGGGGFFSNLGGKIESKMDGMLAVAGGNLYTMAAAQAANLASKVGEVVMESVQLSKEGEGIRIAFERLGRGDLLDGLRKATHGTVTDIELMKAAVKFNDFNLPVEELGTMLAFAQQKAKDTGQSVDYMVDSIVTGLGRKSLMILDNLGLSAAEIKEEMKKTGDMTTAVGAIIRKQMSEAGEYVETAADKAAQADVELKNAMEELGRTFGPIMENGGNMWKSLEVGAINLLNNAVKPLVRELSEAFRLQEQMEQNNKSGVGNASQALGMLKHYSGNKQELYNRQLAKYDQQIQSLWKNYNALMKADNGRGGVAKESAERYRAAALSAQQKRDTYERVGRQYLPGYKQPTTPIDDKPDRTPTRTPSHTTTTPAAELTEEQKIQKQINELVQEGMGMDEKSRTAQREKIAALQAQLEGYKKIKDELLGIQKTEKEVKPEKPTYTQAFTEGAVSLPSIQAYVSGLQSEIANTDIGSDLFNNLTEKMSDAGRMSEVLKAAMESGVQGVDLTSIAQEMKAKLLEGDISDEDWQAFLDKINEKIDNSDLKLKIDVDTKGIVTGADEQKKLAAQTQKAWNMAAQSVGNLSTALNAIEDPAAKAAGTVIKAIADIALGFAQASVQAGSMGPWGWVAWLAAGTAALATTISTVHSLTGFANGGIVPGNSLSGDNVYGGNAMVNSGEVVLTKAQQGNLASQLTDSAVQGFGGQPYVEGEKIFLGMNNSSRRMGRGEIVTTQTLRRMGLTR